jgi:integrase
MARADGVDAADVDLTARMVRVRRSVFEVDNRLVVGPPKSRASNRTVAIPAGIVPDVRAHLAKFAEKGTTGRVFVGPRGATPRRTNFQPTWRTASEAAGLPKGFRFHDLRHTGNTWAAEAGAYLRELMERMGHSSQRAALIYLHATSDGHQSIAERINRRLSDDETGGDDDDGDDDGSSGVLVPP